MIPARLENDSSKHISGIFGFDVNTVQNITLGDFRNQLMLFDTGGVDPWHTLRRLQISWRNIFKDASEISIFIRTFCRKKNLSKFKKINSRICAEKCSFCLQSFLLLRFFQ